MKVSSANKVKGCVIYTALDHKYVFRVYDDQSNFVDYDLAHTDLNVVIDDEDAFFYSDDTANVLDHSPSTLGKEI